MDRMHGHRRQHCGRYPLHTPRSATAKLMLLSPPTSQTKAFLVAIGVRGRVGALLLLLITLGALFAPQLSPADPLKLDGTALLQAPSLSHPFGTDPYGRDTFARVLHGARRSLAVATSSVLLALVCGVLGGLLAGY